MEGLNKVLLSFFILRKYSTAFTHTLLPQIKSQIKNESKMQMKYFSKVWSSELIRKQVIEAYTLNPTVIIFFFLLGWLWVGVMTKICTS